ncbi:MAG: hypothetical protein C5B49_01690 [Bdellovibrio sp.]|nr:MAG: hypothetical protein C5B49_01690 [Bdellovibrio sp.]
MRTVLTLVFALASLASSALAAECVYTLNNKSVVAGWTAYKTNEKLAVGGQFKKVDLSGKNAGPSLFKMVEGVEVRADVMSVNTENPGRDKTLADFFFAKLSPGPAVGKIKQYDEKAGKAVLALTLNGKQKDVPLKVEVKGDNVSATGDIDILDFGGKDAFDSIHAKCLDQHKGKDGVSKTWSAVTLNIKAGFTKACP